MVWRQHLHQGLRQVVKQAPAVSDLHGTRRRMRLDEKIRQQPVQGFSRIRDLVIAAAAANQFQPVQRASPRARFKNQFCVRARLQSCRKRPEKQWVLTPEGLPQRNRSHL